MKERAELPERVGRDLVVRGCQGNRKTGPRTRTDKFTTKGRLSLETRRTGSRARHLRSPEEERKA